MQTDIQLGVLANWNKKKAFVFTTCCAYSSAAYVVECDYVMHMPDLQYRCVYINPYRYVFQGCATLTHSFSSS